MIDPYFRYDIYFTHFFLVTFYYVRNLTVCVLCDRAIDSGRNPAFVTNEFVIKTKQNNDLNKTKGDAIAALRDAMLTKASEIYPEESEAYKALRR